MVLSGLDSNKMALHHENSGSYLLDPTLLVARLTLLPKKSGKK